MKLRLFGEFEYKGLQFSLFRCGYVHRLVIQNPGIGVDTFIDFVKANEAEKRRTYEDFVRVASFRNETHSLQSWQTPNEKPSSLRDWRSQKKLVEELSPEEVEGAIERFVRFQNGWAGFVEKDALLLLKANARWALKSWWYMHL